jgi:hypothetical protein
VDGRHRQKFARLRERDVRVPEDARDALSEHARPTAFRPNALRYAASTAPVMIWMSGTEKQITHFNQVAGCSPRWFKITIWVTLNLRCGIRFLDRSRRHMRIRRGLWLMVITLGLSVASSQASPIFYDEAINGDLIESNPLPTFTLDVGTNVVTGTTWGVCCPFFDFDSFAFVVPLGMQLVNITFSTPSPLWVVFTLQSGSGSHNSGAVLDYLFSPADSLSAELLPLATGIYNLTESQLQVGEPISYTFSLDVELTPEIPEPTVLLLLASGLASMGVRRRRATP